MAASLQQRRETGRRYARVVFGVLSIALLALASVGITSQARLLQRGFRTTGIIISGPLTEGDPKIHVIRFETPTGAEIRFQQSITMYQGLPGALVPVVYDPKDTSHARVATLSALWAEPVTMVVFALMSFGAARAMRRRE